MARKKRAEEPQEEERPDYGRVRFAPAGGTTTEIEFTAIGKASLKKRMAKARAEEAARERELAGLNPGQRRLDGQEVEDEPEGDFFSVMLSAKARRRGYGLAADPGLLDANADEVVCLFDEDVTRKVEVQVRALTRREADKVGKAKVMAMIGSIEALFAGYPAEIHEHSWDVKRP